jgi:hypothetical protein
MSERAGGGTGESTVSKYEMKQLEKQNSRACFFFHAGFIIGTFAVNLARQ